MDQTQYVVAHNLLLLLLYVLFFNGVQSQDSAMATQQQQGGDAVSNFEPSLAVVIGILLIMFSITFFLLIFAKFCRRSRDDLPGFLAADGTFTRSRRFSGIDKKLIESLPFFRFSALKGSREGLECAVCLSKFEDVDILRLLPKCKHAFHIECIDNWLENHSTCPLCRHKLSSDDLRVSNESNLEMLIERVEEGDIDHGSSSHGSSSSRFRSSFRKIFFKGTSSSSTTTNHNSKDIERKREESLFHKYNHRIVMSDVVFKNRWSNVSSSDIMFLNTEMIGALSTDRISQVEQNPNTNDDQVLEIKDSNLKASSSSSSSEMVRSSGEKQRCQSEITGVSRLRFVQLKMKEEGGDGDDKEERRRQLWFPIARRTVQWFANRERLVSRNNHNNNNSIHQQQHQDDLDV